MIQRRNNEEKRKRGEKKGTMNPNISFLILSHHKQGEDKEKSEEKGNGVEGKNPGDKKEGGN